MAAKDRGMAALVKAFAASIGKNVRTAQRMRASNHPDWQRFVGQQATVAVSRDASPGQRAVAVEAVRLKARDADLPVAGPDEDEVEFKPMRDMAEPELMEYQHWMIWKEAARAWRSAMQTGDAVTASGFGQHCIKARGEYIKARQAREAWEASIRRVVPIAEFSALRSQFLIPLANLLRNQPAELARAVNPNDSQHAFKVLSEHNVTRLQPAIQKMLDELDEYTEAKSA